MRLFVRDHMYTIWGIRKQYIKIVRRDELLHMFLHADSLIIFGFGGACLIAFELLWLYFFHSYIYIFLKCSIGLFFNRFEL